MLGVARRPAMNQVQDFKFLYIEAEQDLEIALDTLADLYPLVSPAGKAMIRETLRELGRPMAVQRASEQEEE
jgi:hypothetical protein